MSNARTWRYQRRRGGKKSKMWWDTWVQPGLSLWHISIQGKVQDRFPSVSTQKLDRNLEGDLGAGALRDPDDPERGYRLLWVLVWATLIGFALQRLAIKLAAASGKHLTSVCYMAFPKWLSVTVWLITELCLIGCDSQAVIGSAIAFRLLFGIPLEIGIVITLMDAFIILLFTCIGIRKLEACFSLLIAFMGSCFLVNMFKSRPTFAYVARGLAVVQIPSGTLQFAIALIGCVIMPHNFFLQSSVVHHRTIDRTNPDEVKRVGRIFTYETFAVLVVSCIINVAVVAAFANPNIVIPGDDEELTLYNAHVALTSALGWTSALVWGLGLLTAGICSTMAGTYTGQFVMEDFLGLKIKRLWLRVLITRLISIGPLLFLVLMTRESMETVPNAVNIMQALLLPFVVVLLIKFTTDERIMGVHMLTFATKVIGYMSGVALIAINIAFFITTLGAETVYVYVILAVYLLLLGFLWWRPLTIREDPSFHSSLSTQSKSTVGGGTAIPANKECNKN